MIGITRNPGYLSKRISRFSEYAGSQDSLDQVVVEEPLEIRISHLGKIRRIAVTMRTPVSDRELAVGFLFTEGIIKSPTDIVAVDHTQGENVVTVELGDKVNVAEPAGRNFFLSSSCGVCGKESINDIFVKGRGIIRDSFTVEKSVVLSLTEKMQRNQQVFEFTGGIHAAGIFDTLGAHIVTMEDVGRHNAVDKCIGYLLSNKILGKQPLILQISGRAGFEILQKAAIAGLPFVSSVSAPSTLAIEVADTFGITLASFVRKDRFNVYSHQERVR